MTLVTPDWIVHERNKVEPESDSQDPDVSSPPYVLAVICTHAELVGSLPVAFFTCEVQGLLSTKFLWK